MGIDEPNNEDNHPASISPFQKNDEFALSFRQNGAADCSGIFHNGNSAGDDLLSFPYVSQPLASSPWQIMHGNCHSYAHAIPETGGNKTTDFMKINSLDNPQIDPNFINFNTNIPSILKVSEISYREGNMRGTHQSINDNYSVAEDNLSNGSSSFQYLQNNRNFMPMAGNKAGYQVTRLGGEAKSSNVNKPQINGNFARLRCSTPILYHTQNSGKLETDKDVNVTAAQFGCSEKIDGSFLTLGIGGNSEARSKSVFSAREIASKLEGALCPQLNTSHVQQTTRSSSSLGHNLAGGLSSFQNNACVFSSPVSTMAGWPSSNNDVGVTHGAKTGSNSSPFHILQTRQMDVQRNSFVPGDMNSGFVSKTDLSCADFDVYKGPQGDKPASLGPFSSSSAAFLSSGQSALSELASESAKPTWITTQPTSDQLRGSYSKIANDFLPVPSIDSPFPRLRESSTWQDRSGQLYPALEINATQVAQSGQFCWRTGQLFSSHDSNATQAAGPKRIGVQVNEGSATQVATGGLFPERFGVQVNVDGAAPADEGGLFPKRIGVPVTEGGASQAAESRLYSKGMGFQTASNFRRPQESGPSPSPMNLLGPPFAIGRPQRGLPVQFPLHGPSSTTGQPRDNLPIQFSRDLLQPASTSGQVSPVAKVNMLSQVSNVLGRPSLKRTAIHSPPTAHWVQRRKLTPQAAIHPSMPFPLQTVPPHILIPPAPPHIKWQGFDGLRPTGQKCLLCKRDLSFTPEGPLYQPTVPPAVAVLPCGHTFHDHCLQIITPQDQCKNPPCIPCAIGET